MRDRVAALAAVSAFAVGIAGVAVVAARSGDPTLPRLPTAADSRAEAADMASGMAMGAGRVEYVVKGELPSLPERAPAFRLPADDDRGAVRRFAAALGLSGTAVQRGSRYLVAEGDRHLTVEAAPGMPWYLGRTCDDGSGAAEDEPGSVPARPPDAPTSSSGGERPAPSLAVDPVGTGAGTGGSGAVSSPPGGRPVPQVKARHGAVASSCVGVAVAPAPMPSGPVARHAAEPHLGESRVGSGGSAPGGAPGGAPPPPPETLVAPPKVVAPPTPLPPPAPPVDLPPRDRAEQVARDVFARLGLSPDDLRLDGGLYSWEASTAPPVAGLRVLGFQHTLSIGAAGAIQGGHGYLLEPRRLGEYPLAGVDVGLARLRADGGIGPIGHAQAGIEPYCPPTADCVAPPTGVATVVITSVHLALQHVADALVPVYVFQTEDGGELPVPAVTDRWLRETGPTGGGDDGPEPDVDRGTSSCGASAAVQGHSEGAGVEKPNAPLVVEVCIEPATAKVGQEVSFKVTVTDPDAEIYTEVCAGPQVSFGDEGLVARTLCAHVCDAGGRAPYKTDRRRGELSRKLTHTYAKPGTYTAGFAYRSDPCSKWSSTGETTVTVTVV